ncbi:uncharacterized protein LOC110943766 [Helianthus annuus]|uniref:uncharacterized protein LOC110943766 n=1 Tax=Helianthus annuus TaxID=4232 RepID=UPI000B902D10|nr:uncharacterized protein LOC110943766 [Helianthus annuus]
MDNQEFYKAFFRGGMTVQTPASIAQNVNMENELGTMQKSSKLLNIEEYSGWQDRFRTWVQANHLECWLKVETKYVIPTNEAGLPKTLNKLTPAEAESFKAEKKMVSILQQAIKEDILVLLQHQNDTQSIWNALKLKFLGSAAMIKSKKALLKKEFDIFTAISGESTKELIERYCHLVLEMKRLSIDKTNEELVDKLANALPQEVWGTFLLVLKNNLEYVGFNLSMFVERIEAQELEMRKMSKMKSANVQQDVQLYYKGSSSATSTPSPKIQTAFSADSSSGISQSMPNNNVSPFPNYEPNPKVQNFQEQVSSQSSSGSNNQSYSHGILCNIAVNIKNGQDFTETAAKQHIAFLASVLESYESLVAGRIGGGLAMMAEIVEECIPEVEEVSEMMTEESYAELEEAAAAVYYYQSEQEVSLVNRLWIIDVAKEMNEETLKEIADKALMVKLQEVEQTKTPSDNNGTKDATQKSVSIEKESNEKSESDGK